MGRRIKWKKWAAWKWFLVVLALLWIAQESRFYFPKWIRPPKNVQPVEIEMKTTSYCHCRRCCSYKWFLFIPYQKAGFMKYRLKHVGITSSGVLARPGTIAADTSIYPYGTVMYIPGYGYGRVEDTGGAIKGQHIDLFRPNHWLARHWGVRTKKVKVWLPAKGGAWSYNPPTKNAGIISNKLPFETVTSNTVPPIQPTVSNEIPGELQVPVANEVDAPVSTEQIPLP